MPATANIPRVVIGATGSGVGKTTATIGLIAALRARGFKVAGFKCGPDYLDPTYHARVLGKLSQNLDSWMMGRDAVLATFARGAADADVAVIEGMMGLFDSATPAAEEGSTAEIAKWLRAPVILVADASGIARTVNAIAAGFARFDPMLRVAGMICNRVGSRGHLDLLREARPEIPIVGAFPEDRGASFPERHLGLRTADRDSVPEPLFETWGRLAAEWLDLDAIVTIARSASPIESDAPRFDAAVPTRRCRIGVALDEAFHFYYQDNLRRLESLGAEIVNFAPTRDRVLPDVDGLYFGGGYPEVVARELSSNAELLAAIRGFAAGGRPIYAECGGLMYLSEGIRTLDGQLWPMLGLIPGAAVMSERLQALGYVEVETSAASLIGPAGTRFRGHQFRYSALEPRGGSASAERVYQVKPRWGGEAFVEGYRAGNVLASYVHAHWASNPDAAAAFVRSCESSRRR